MLKSPVRQSTVPASRAVVAQLPTKVMQSGVSRVVAGTGTWASVVKGPRVLRGV